MCGEKVFAYADNREAMGSPPHVRGKEPRFPHLLPDSRITPACAGKSHFRQIWKSGGRDHPRMCGEKWMVKRHRILRQGSPPHVRGKEMPQLEAAMDEGITPACAGKRLWWCWFIPVFWDHPRMCGEKPPTGTASSCPSGITPACAGKSISSKFTCFGSGDHPRMCGEKENNPCYAVMAMGSPPHVRGKAFEGHLAQVPSGITPACAGKRSRKPNPR